MRKVNLAGCCFFCPFLIMMILPLLVVLVVVVVVAVASDASNVVVVAIGQASTMFFIFPKQKHRRGWGSSESKVVSPHLWNTPLNLYQQTIKGFLS